MELTITDPKRITKEEQLSFNKEFVVASMECVSKPDIFAHKNYNVYFDGVQERK